MLASAKSILIHTYNSPLLLLPQAINVQNSKGQTALMLACRGGHYACAKFLLVHGASPLPADEQVLGVSCWVGNVGNVYKVWGCGNYQRAKFLDACLPPFPPFLLPAGSERTALCCSTGQFMMHTILMPPPCPPLLGPVHVSLLPFLPSGSERTALRRTGGQRRVHASVAQEGGALGYIGTCSK